MYGKEENLMRVQVTETGSYISVTAPYLPTFPRKARAIKGADFDRATKNWLFPPNAAQQVEDLMLYFYGEYKTEVPRVDVAVNLSEFGTRQRGFFGLGRQIANRGRDGKFYLGTDVVHIGGTLPSEFNTETPDMIGYNTAILKVCGVPEELAKREAAQHPNTAMVILTDEIEQTDSEAALGMMKVDLAPGNPLPSSEAELSALKHQLLTRLAEVQQKIIALRDGSDASL